MVHWNLMKSYQLLKDQKVIQELPSFSDADEELNDTLLTEPRDEALEQEILLADRRAKREIRTLEEELNRLQALVEMVPSCAYTDRFDSTIFAVLRGRHVRYLMRSKEVRFYQCYIQKSLNFNRRLPLDGLPNPILWILI